MSLLKHKLTLLPDKPGVYLMKDITGKIIYVGKAKVLKNRVRSYFSGSHDAKTQALVANICDFEYIVTDSAVEALILECNLIKQHNPKYNILLKDDKTYPYLKITQETHPRLIVTRKVEKDHAHYFGPYPNATAAKETARLLNKIFPLRKCSQLKQRACLYYHLDQCLAPCQFPVDNASYQPIIQQTSALLKGGEDAIILALQQRMQDESAKLNYERAKELRDQIVHLQHILQKQKITNPDNIDRDVFGFAYDKGLMAVQIFFVRQGKLIARDASIFAYHSDETEAFLSFVQQFYFNNQARPKEILLPSDSDLELLNNWLKVPVKTPRRGSKKELVEMATSNAKLALQEHFSLLTREEERTSKALTKLGELLGIPTPNRIEAFDNSNIQGSDPVAAMVVFINSKPCKSEYRKYKVRSVTGPDDYATMAEVLNRRYSRLLQEQCTLPQLVLVDGGKGQVNIAQQVLADLGLAIPIAGMAKDDLHKTSELVLPGEQGTLSLNKNSQEFYLVQRIQDEVHRFAITFHRQRRDKNMLSSILDEIPGVGSKRRQKLLKHFGSVKKIREASPEDFRQIGIGKKLAQVILTALNKDAAKH
ncbi:MAG: excinuclease ABC subunit UvrC [Peptococcaceae bacterium]|nr:excinuclease ABC subunit UvrC [Peptococcaceae bacterium]